MGKLSDALKALFGSNKTTGTYVPLVTSNGTPNGNMSMDNLASVLGALTIMNKSSTGIPAGGPANYGHYYQCKNSYYQFNVVMGISSGNCTGIWVAGANAEVAYENLVWHKLSWT